MLEQLKSLAERLEGLSGPDREVDALIESAFDPDWVPDTEWKFGFVRNRGCPTWIKSSATFTSSLDAAVALVERVMVPMLLDIEGSWKPRDRAVWPAWSVRWYPAAVDRNGKNWRAVVGTGPTPAIALLRALVSAKIEEARTVEERGEQAAISTTQLGGKGHP